MPPSSDQQDSLKDQPVTSRSACLGLFLSGVIGFGAQYLADQGGHDFMTYAHLPSAFLIPFLVLILLPNLIFKQIIPHRALTSTELLVVFAMGWVASMAPDWGITKYLVSAIAAPAYYATPENRWDELILPYLPAWVYVSDYESARRFYEGLQPGQPIPWGVWLIPLLWWLSLFAALLLIGASMMVVFRKQWVEYERLRFPMGEVAMHLIGESSPHSKRPRSKLYRNRTFQIGCIMTFLAMAWNCLSYWGVWPALPIYPGALTTIELSPSFPGIPIYFNIYVLCFAFFANTEILFSLWFFQLFGIMEQGLLSRIGLFSTTGSVVQGGLTGMQYMGGVIVFVVWITWMARRHLYMVWCSAWSPGKTESENDELFSYRRALIGLVAGSIYVILWLNQVGLSIYIGLFFLAAMFTFYLALARAVAESGLIMAELTVKSNYFTVGVIGSGSMSMEDINTLGMASGFARNARTFSMIGFSHVAWLKSRMRGPRQRLFFWICVSFGVSTVVSVVSMIHSGHALGANNLWTTPGGFGTFFYGRVPVWAANFSQIGVFEILFFISGILINALVIAGRAWFSWWPFHPIGMAIGDVGSVVRNAFLPLFLAWLIQILLVRFGGVRLYQAAQPFFLGMLVGFLMGVGLSLVVDMVWFPATPHRTEWF